MSDEDWPDIRADDPQELLRYFWRLRGSFSRDCAAVGDRELNRLVRDGLALCNSMDIKDPQDVLRFLALSFLITPEQRASRFLMKVHQLIIENTDVSARRRLNFLFRHLVGRPAPLSEPDFGQWSIGL